MKKATTARIESRVPINVKNKLHRAAKSMGLTDSAWLSMHLSLHFMNIDNKEKSENKKEVVKEKDDAKTRSQNQTSAMYCEHANENPAVCRCPADCYCQTRTCKDRVLVCRGLLSPCNRAAKPDSSLCQECFDEFKSDPDAYK